MKKYPSKISYGLLGIILVVLIGSTIPVLSPPKWLPILINLSVLLFVGHLFTSTYYLVDGNVLIIKSGFVVNKKIEIGAIRKIAETNNMLSSPALSLDRLEIWYNIYDSILISPKDKSEFIKHLVGLNPEIMINCKPT